MTGLEIVMLVLRWLHILSAIAMMGGAIFMRVALLPAAETLSAEAHEQLRSAMRPRWARVVMAASGLLLLSGFANFGITVAMYSFDKATLLGSHYHLFFGVKFALALPVFYIAATLVGRSEAAQRVRANARFWLTLNLILATLVVCFGGVLRFTPRQLKAERATSQAAVDVRSW